MKLVLLALLSTGQGPDECPATLVMRGVGGAVARQVRPYADCLNSRIGTAEQLGRECAEARRKAVPGQDRPTLRTQTDQALVWLDAMAHWRNDCETTLEVKGDGRASQDAAKR